MLGSAGNGNFFLSLLPPKKVLDAFEPVAAQLQFQPQPQHVVRLSEIMKERPSHPSMTLQKALTRLAPTCRKLWNQMDWISHTVSQVCCMLEHGHGCSDRHGCCKLLQPPHPPCPHMLQALIPIDWINHTSS